MDDDDAMNAQIAAAMGFSSFGSQDKHGNKDEGQSSPQSGSASKRAQLDTEEDEDMNPEAPEFKPSGSGAKKATGSNTTPLASRTNKSAGNKYVYPYPNLTPSSVLPPRPRKASETAETKDGGEDNGKDNGVAEKSSNNVTATASGINENKSEATIRDPDNEIAYTSPVGITYTAKQLRDYSAGRIKNEMGDPIYFRPSFLEDPWADLHKAKGIKLDGKPDGRPDGNGKGKGKD